MAHHPTHDHSHDYWHQISKPSSAAFAATPLAQNAADILIGQRRRLCRYSLIATTPEQTLAPRADNLFVQQKKHPTFLGLNPNNSSS